MIEVLFALPRIDLKKCNPHPGAQEKLMRGDDGCMPGKGGKCVLCGTGDCLRRPE